MYLNSDFNYRCIDSFTVQFLKIKMVLFIVPHIETLNLMLFTHYAPLDSLGKHVKVICALEFYMLQVFTLRGFSNFALLGAFRRNASTGVVYTFKKMSLETSYSPEACCLHACPEH